MKNPFFLSVRPFFLKKKGFTLVELLIFAAIFVLVMISFITIFVSITRVGVRQNAAAEVNQQSQFLLQQIQYYVERSSLIELGMSPATSTTDFATSTLKLRMAASSEDPTYIYLSGSTVYLKQTDAGTPQPMTSSKVNVTALNFTKRSNTPSHDSVSISFTVAYNTTSLQQQFSESLTTAIARVNAATFDSNVIPSSTATYKIGTSAQTWTTINDIINFSGSNVGINLGVGVSPTQVLQVGGGDVYISTAGDGVMLKKPDGSACVRLSYTNGGALATTSVTCT